MSATLWSEARCGKIDMEREPNKYYCHETSPGSFSARYTRRRAREAGWTIVDGDWCCPACKRVIQLERKAT